MPKRLTSFRALLLRTLLLFLMLGPATLFSQTTPPSASSPLAVQGLGNATALLDGPWQFHTGDSPAWASPTLDDSTWERLSVDKSWGAQTHFDYAGFGWYRRHLHFDSNFKLPPDLTLNIPNIDQVGEIYWNGQLIGHLGTPPPHPSWNLGSRRVTVPFHPSGDGVLAIRVWKPPYFSGDPGDQGGLSGVPRLGSAQAIADHNAMIDYHRLENLLIPAVFWLLSLLVGLVGLIGWLQRRDRKVLFWMAIWSFTVLASTVVSSLGIPWPAGLGMFLTQPLFGMLDISVWFLLLHLLELDRNQRLSRWIRRLAWIGIALQTLDGFLIPIAWRDFHVLFCQTVDFVLSFLYAPLELIPLLLIALALRKRLGFARWLVAGLGAAFQLTVGLRNTLSQGQRFTHWTIANDLNLPQSIEYVLLMLAIVYAVWRFSREQNARHTSLEQEFKSAQELQRVLIPETLPPLPGFAVTSAYRPAQEVGGDFFQVIPHSDGSAIIVLGDVSGKGLKAAMTVSMIVGAVRTLAEATRDPEKILSGLNRRLVGRLQQGFATCLVMRVDIWGSCVIANAGHLPPFLNDREIDLPGSLPLGLIREAAYDKIMVQLEIDDRLTLYTDGLLEARNHRGELFGFDRLRTLIASAPDAREATEAAIAFGQDDDVTVLTLVCLAAGAKSTTTTFAASTFASLRAS
jgi:serine phosphatase RsbU (regulator of sigma subunit)